MSDSRCPLRRRPALMWAARVGQAAWFFGNLYEGLIGMPQLLADTRGRRSQGLLAAGSPVRYFAPVAAVALGPTAVTLAESWRAGSDRRLIAATATGVGTALALSGYLIRVVNLPLLTGSEPLPEVERNELVATWHRLNVVRLAALAGAFISSSSLAAADSARDDRRRSVPAQHGPTAPAGRARDRAPRRLRHR